MFLRTEIPISINPVSSFYGGDPMATTSKSNITLTAKAYTVQARANDVRTSVFAPPDEKSLSMWETWEAGETYRLSAESSAKVLASLETKPKPTEAALRAAHEFNARSREINGVRSIL